jgi:putative tricarboxylic transport membrane protein
MDATPGPGAAADRPPGGISVGAAEIATALVLAGIGAAAIWDSLRLGAGWGPDGPRSGTFPFWMGLVLVLAGLGTAGRALRAARAAGPGAMFVTWPQLRLVLSVLAPTAAYVAAIPFAGIYLASALLVMWFMLRLGGFSWRSALPAGLATAAVAFTVFEIWFLVALPKGPIEAWLGF